ncbi:MAG: CPXCG motif-containing cysteine-rich protein [Neptuniibacter sp.]
MEFLEERLIDCPSCGESITVLLDEQEAGHEYTEDCQVCCKPIVFNLSTAVDGSLYISVRTENDTY